MSGEAMVDAGKAEVLDGIHDSDGEALLEAKFFEDQEEDAGFAATYLRTQANCLSRSVRTVTQPVVLLWVVVASFLLTSLLENEVSDWLEARAAEKIVWAPVVDEDLQPVVASSN